MLQNIQLPISDHELETIIIEGNGELLVKKAQEIGDILGTNNALTTSQIRAVFGTVRLIEMNWKTNITASIFKLNLLIPKMEYRAAKDKIQGRGLGALSKVFSKAIHIIVQETNEEKERDAYFIHFVNFFEAILAYHRVAGGK